MYLNIFITNLSDNPPPVFVHASYVPVLIPSYPFDIESKNQHPYFIKFGTNVNCKVTSVVNMSIIVEALAKSL